MQTAFLSLGTNLGDRLANMNAMLGSCEKLFVDKVRHSPLYETDPVGTSAEHMPYLNRIIAGEFDGIVADLLACCQSIEISLGRQQSEKGKVLPRQADIDILLFGNEIISDEILTVPHPAILGRRFCIEGIAAIDADIIHPIYLKTFRQLFTEMSQEIKRQKIFIVD